MPTRPLAHKVAVITGASRGIGRALAEVFASAGCSLALCARTPDPAAAQDLANRHGVPVLSLACDVRSEVSVADFFSAVREKFGRIHFLLNNAGLAGPAAKIEDIQLDNWLNIMATNVTGTFLCTRAALPLIESGGAIVNTLSIASRRAFTSQGAYVAAKHAAAGFTDVLREEARPRFIRVIGVYPGATSTDIWDQFWPTAPRENMMTPETIAQAILNAVLLPDSATMEELVLRPTAEVFK